MTISSDKLLSAIYSMDVYNRGYDAGISTLSSVVDGTSKLGSSTIVSTSTIELGNGVDSLVGFYALAYDTDGDGQADLISYRGTDYPQNDNLIPKDISNGWILGAGDIDSPQGKIALEFYKEIASSTTNTITLTGHSLGGGLSGYVAFSL